MNTKLNHQEFINIKLKEPEYLSEFFEGISTIKELIKKIDKFSETDYQKFNYPDPEKFKGNVFEIFAEVFFKLFSSHNKIGIYNYQPVNGNQDYGVDGTGIGMDGKPSTIQVKFRKNYTSQLTSDDLKQFPFQSIVQYGVEPKTRSNMVVFTTAKDLHWVTDGNVFLGRITTIGYQAISAFVDNNWVFWKNFTDIINQKLH
jgi:hypothetical protein